MGSTVEVIITIVALSFWFLFPIGMFISVSHVDKNTDQIVRLEKLRHDSVEPIQPVRTRKPQKDERVPRFDWHHPIMYFRQWLQH